MTWYCSVVTWASWCIKSPITRLSVYANINESPNYWTFVGQSTDDRCIPLTETPWRTTRFHVMTSSQEENFSGRFLPTWINFNPSKNKLLHPFPNFNGATIEVWECISNFIPHLPGHMMTYPCRDLRLTISIKGAPDVISGDEGAFEERITRCRAQQKSTWCNFMVVFKLGGCHSQWHGLVKSHELSKYLSSWSLRFEECQINSTKWERLY